MLKSLHDQYILFLKADTASSSEGCFGVRGRLMESEQELNDLDVQ